MSLFVTAVKVLIAMVIILFGVCAVAEMAACHESCKPEEADEDEEDGATCPYCEKALTRQADGGLGCDCPEVLSILSSGYCERHDILYTGKQCPKCHGEGRWC